MRKIETEIAVIGGSLGGVQAALAACRLGRKVYLCEETDWLGGQLTAQAVPPDEHVWIEQQGASKGYLDYRRAVRNEYLNLPDASEMLKQQTVFCPGRSWVSRVAHDPRIALKLLLQSLKPYLDNGQLTVDYFTAASEAQTAGDRVKSVVVRQIKTGDETLIEAAYYLDATDCGDLLPLTGTEYVLGAESRDQTAEPHAPETADSEDVQPITWVAALELTSEREWMPKPEMYDEIADMRVPYGDHSQLSWFAPRAAGGTTEFCMFDGEIPGRDLGLWSYRRIQYPPYFTTAKNEISLLNWPQNDYITAGVIDVPDRDEQLKRARQLTLSCAYWLWEQGYPVRLCPEAVGTQDGLAKAPYIRESRRIAAVTTIREQDVAKDLRDQPLVYEDSVGVGHYHMDLHMTIKTRACFYAPVHPFEIPLGALLPVRMKNLLPACKNIGTTHLTSGCYRLHPVEWSIGEAAGALAAFCLLHGTTPHQVRQSHLRDYQRTLEQLGAQLHWQL